MVTTVPLCGGFVGFTYLGIVGCILPFAGTFVFGGYFSCGQLSCKTWLLSLLLAGPVKLGHSASPKEYRCISKKYQS